LFYFLPTKITFIPLVGAHFSTNADSKLTLLSLGPARLRPHLPFSYLLFPSLSASVFLLPQHVPNCRGPFKIPPKHFLPRFFTSRFLPPRHTPQTDLSSLSCSELGPIVRNLAAPECPSSSPLRTSSTFLPDPLLEGRSAFFTSCVS